MRKHTPSPQTDDNSRFAEFAPSKPQRRLTGRHEKCALRRGQAATYSQFSGCWFYQQPQIVDKPGFISALFIRTKLRFYG